MWELFVQCLYTIQELSGIYVYNINYVWTICVQYFGQYFEKFRAKFRQYLDNVKILSVK